MQISTTDPRRAVPGDLLLFADGRARCVVYTDKQIFYADVSRPGSAIWGLIWVDFAKVTLLPNVFRVEEYAAWIPEVLKESYHE